MDLIELIKEKIRKDGLTKSREYFIKPDGKKVTMVTLSKWRDGDHCPPAWAAQRIFTDVYLGGRAFDMEAEIPADGEDICILLPTYRSASPRTMFCITTLMRKYGDKIKLYTKEYNGLIDSRNTLATMFVHKTDATYCLFIDDDMLVPIGSSEIYNGKWNAGIGAEYARMDIISRLMSHKVDIVSGLYTQRSPNGRPVYQAAMNNEVEAGYARRSPRDELRDAKGWVGMGATLIHRRVFERIEEMYEEVSPLREGMPYQYFTPVAEHRATMAEDAAFCFRAKKAGFTAYVDLGCICGHEGMATYWTHKNH